MFVSLLNLNSKLKPREAKKWKKGNQGNCFSSFCIYFCGYIISSYLRVNMGN